MPHEELQRALFSQLPSKITPSAISLTASAVDALDRLLLPSLEREVRRDLTEVAEKHAVDVFARNLRSLLLQPPINRQRVLAIDPGFRTGCKVAILDEIGNLLEHEVIHPFQPQNRRAEAKLKLKDLVAKYQVNVVAIGNGTACRETEELIAELITEGTYFHTNPGETTCRACTGRCTNHSSPPAPPTAEADAAAPATAPAEVTAEGVGTESTVAPAEAAPCGVGNGDRRHVRRYQPCRVGNAGRRRAGAGRPPVRGSRGSDG